MGLRDHFLAASTERVEVVIPGWDEPVFVRKLTLQETLDLLTGDKPTALRTAELVALSVVDPDGDRVFTTDDVEALANGPHGAALLRISAAAMRFNGLDQDAPERLGKG